MLAVSVGGLFAFMSACNGADEPFAVASAGPSPARGSSGVVDPSVVDLPGEPPTESPLPVVACSDGDFERPDGGRDAGLDADVEDGGVDLGDAHVDSGPSRVSLCAVPPPAECSDNRQLVEYAPGRCLEGKCVFIRSVVTCPGGCFRRLDGDLQCNR
jgi:hypothetical protein